MWESTNKTRENISHSPQGRKESATSSHVPHKESSLLSRLKRKADVRVPTSSSSSKESGATTESESLRTRLMTSLGKFSLIVNAVRESLKYKLSSKLIKMRTPVPEFVLHPDPRLKLIAEEVMLGIDTREEIVKIIRQMGAALGAATYGDKLGLAAPQIGIDKRIIIVRGVVMINPEWHPSEAPKNALIEGCYSVPHRRFRVERSPYGWASWYSVDGEFRKFKLNGINAIVFQHELDHLNGFCCADVGTEIYDTEPEPSRVLDESKK